MKESRGVFLYVFSYVLVIFIIWGLAYYVGKKTEDVQVVSPTKNIKCVIVSRTFNTSVDCWKVSK